MFVKEGYRDESIAYALAAGLVAFTDDQNGEKLSRRQRYERRRGPRD